MSRRMESKSGRSEDQRGGFDDSPQDKTDGVQAKGISPATTRQERLWTHLLCHEAPKSAVVDRPAPLEPTATWHQDPRRIRSRRPRRTAYATDRVLSCYKDNATPPAGAVLVVLPD